MIEYHAYFHPLLCNWIARWGTPDSEIAASLGIEESILIAWKQEHPELDRAIDDGRAYWVQLAENSLQKLALGYDHEETEITIEGEGDKKKKKMKKISRHVPPNAAAVLFLIQNRLAFQLAKQIQDDLPVGARDSFSLPKKKN